MCCLSLSLSLGLVNVSSVSLLISSLSYVFAHTFCDAQENRHLVQSAQILIRTHFSTTIEAITALAFRVTAESRGPRNPDA